MQAVTRRDHAIFRGTYGVCLISTKPWMLVRSKKSASASLRRVFNSLAFDGRDKSLLAISLGVVTAGALSSSSVV